MNIFKKIALINKISKTIKEAKKIIDNNQGLADKVKKIIENFKKGFEELIEILPVLKDIEKELIDLIKGN